MALSVCVWSEALLNTYKHKYNNMRNKTTVHTVRFCSQYITVRPAKD